MIKDIGFTVFLTGGTEMAKPIVFLTGATGTMGMESLKAMVKDLDLYDLRILAKTSEKKQNILAPYEKRHEKYD